MTAGIANRIFTTFVQLTLLGIDAFAFKCIFDIERNDPFMFAPLIDLIDRMRAKRASKHLVRRAYALPRKNDGTPERNPYQREIKNVPLVQIRRDRD